ncbi:hypothetical protein TRICI_003285 [Trichomonascus ciferrii]|uniref:Uncharacterized protein n=1 Tax=Trichomonascus ciferrii TaxID=44093 RepID=A0A642V4F5_9ASCO|nr:hypothetical protein TRICI_003285 [Trichomonascus ciferrii]
MPISLNAVPASGNEVITEIDEDDISRTLTGPRFVKELLGLAQELASQVKQQQDRIRTLEDLEKIGQLARDCDCNLHTLFNFPSLDRGGLFTAKVPCWAAVAKEAAERALKHGIDVEMIKSSVIMRLPEPAASAMYSRDWLVEDGFQSVFSYFTTTFFDRNSYITDMLIRLDELMFNRLDEHDENAALILQLITEEVLSVRYIKLKLSNKFDMQSQEAAALLGCLESTDIPTIAASFNRLKYGSYYLCSLCRSKGHTKSACPSSSRR